MLLVHWKKYGMLRPRTKEEPMSRCLYIMAGAFMYDVISRISWTNWHCWTADDPWGKIAVVFILACLCSIVGDVIEDRKFKRLRERGRHA